MAARYRVHRAFGGLAALGLLLGGCATADTVNFANGQPGYSIGCPWGLNGLSQCYQKAGSLCGEHGYTLRDWQGRTLTFSAVEQNLDNNYSSATAKAILAQCNP
jgi:hypothetical protein